MILNWTLKLLINTTKKNKGGALAIDESSVKQDF